ncbi:MAG: HDOD domain-containing protein, partial [Campylobacter sp.]|nr:HDOD domain-containing protein [Campylobacter sp.]
VENEFLGVDHISFLGFLLANWNFDEHLIETICFVHSPHSASQEVIKSAYSLAIIDRIFSPYDGSSAFNVQSAIALIEEAKHMGINFNLDHFISKLPQKAKDALNQKDN